MNTHVKSRTISKEKWPSCIIVPRAKSKFIILGKGKSLNSNAKKKSAKKRESCHVIKKGAKKKKHGKVKKKKPAHLFDLIRIEMQTL